MVSRTLISMLALAVFSASIVRAEEGENPDEVNARKLIFKLQNVGPKGVLVPLLDLMEAGKISAGQADEVLWSISSALEAADLEIVFDRALKAKPENAAFQVKLLQSLGGAQNDRDVKPSGDVARLKALLESKDEGVRAEAMRLAGGWKAEAFRDTLAKAAEAADSSASLRAAAMDGLAKLAGAASTELFKKLSAADRTPAIRYAAVAHLAALDLAAAAPIAAEVLTAEPVGNGASDVFAAFVKRDGGSEALAAALKGKKIPADAAKIGLRFLQALGGEENDLVKVLRPAAALTTDIAELEPAEQQKIIKEVIAEVAAKGDPARGELVFRRTDLNCLSCHGIGGAGGQVGPDLAGIGAGAQIDYLVEAVLLPSKVVKEGFEGALVATKKGEFFTGVVKAKTEEEITIRDAVHGEMTFPVADLKRHKILPVSLMPNGLTATLTRGETLDLVRFLSNLGRDPYSVTAAPIARRWRVLNPVPDDVASLEAKDVAKLAAGDKLAWSAAYSLVSGVLPVSDLMRAKTRPVAFARFEFEMTTPGKFRLKLNSPKGLSLSIGETPLDTKGDLTFEAPRGVHAVTVRVDLEQRGSEALKIELEEIPDSPGRFQMVGGK